MGVLRLSALTALALAAAPGSAGGVPPFPAGFHTQEIATHGATIHVRVGGNGPGGRAAARLWRDRRHVGAAGRRAGARPHGRSSPTCAAWACRRKPAGGFDKKTQAGDVAGVLDALERRAGRRRRARHRQHGRLTPSPRSTPIACDRLVLIDAPVPGVGPWEEILKNPLLWHFRFGGPDMERLVAGRERIYLDRFWNEFSADPEALRRGRARALRQALCAARRDAFGLRAVRAPSTRTPSTTSAFLAQGRQARHAGAGDRRREVVRADDGDRDARRRDRRRPRASSRIRATGSWKRTRTATVALVTAFLAKPLPAK